MRILKICRLSTLRWILLMIALLYCTTGQPEQQRPDTINRRAQALTQRVNALEKKMKSKAAPAAFAK